MHNLSYENKFDLHENEPVSYEWFRSYTRLDTEAKASRKWPIYLLMCFNLHRAMLAQ